MPRPTPRPPSRLPRYSTTLIYLAIVCAIVSACAIGLFLHFSLPQWEPTATITAILLGMAGVVKIGSMVARREWPGFYKAIGIVFILLTLFLTSTYLFADTVAPNNADSSTATLLAGIPTMFMALVFEVARRLSRK